jgi:hypothetical protein
MAARDPLHQPSSRSGELVFTGSRRQLPLLPFEKQLIELLGCKEEEYRRFVQEAQRRGVTRPAEYALVPDVQNTGAEIIAIASLVIGLASTAVSFLLAPKPKAISAGGPDEVRQLRLASRTGVDRFSPTTGFDTQAELANYGDPIPIIFGEYTGATGGILASPRLVWSRAFSLGSQQAVKLMFVVGEQGLNEGLNRPELNGVFLGNTALDAIFAHNFAFYWKRNTNTFSRLKATNFAYGSRGNRSSGDIENNDDIFLCPTRNGLLDTGFSSAFSLSSSTQFGVYSAIPNGTNYRINFKIVPIVDNGDITRSDPGSVLIAERIKVSGDYGYNPLTVDGQTSIWRQGQKGVGRNYGRRMGLTHFNGVESTARTEVKQATVGAKVTFTITGGSLPENLYHLNPQFANVSVDDINYEIESQRRVADEMLQLGETIMIGRTAWVVEHRDLQTWEPGATQSIVLRCVETFGLDRGNSVGLVGTEMVTRGVYNDDNGTTNARNGLGLSAGAGYYPLLRVSFGIVRNTRACDVTEIGIRSQVWQRVNGLCNFASLPQPHNLVQSERDRVQIQSGTMTLYMKRTAVWTIWLRPSGTDESGNEYAWAALGEQFCVTGETPQDQFNFIRIRHPERKQFEYKMVPKSGADIAKHSPDDAQFWRLDAKQETTLSGTYETAYGNFEITSAGQIVTVGQISFNVEMMQNAFVNAGEVDATIPDAIEVENYIPDVEDETVTARTVGFYDWLPDTSEQGRRGATHFELFGQPSYTGLTATATRTANLGDGRSITIEFNGIVDDQYPVDHPYFASWKQWSFSSINVVESSGGFNTNQVFNVSIPVSPGNLRAAPYGLTSVGVRLIVLSTDAGFQPLGRESAWEWELLGDAQQYPLGHTQTASFRVPSSSGASATINATGLVTSRNPGSLANFPSQTQAWDVTYTVDPFFTYGDWQNGALMENSAVVSAGNPFKKAGTTVGIKLRVLSLTTITIPPGFNADRIFEENSQINDISLYSSLIQKSNESQPEHEIVYVNETIANETTPDYRKLTICGLALKASRNFTSLNQLRVWLANGISVRKFHSDAPEPIGPSNKFTDLVYYLLTDKTAGAGAVVSPELIKTEDFPATSQFLKQNKLFFDGAIDQPTNLRQFISDTAPFFLCNFVIAEGKFSVIPAVPFDSTGSISNQPVTIKQLFTSGNITEDSFSVEYLSAEERKDFQAVMRYRKEQRNQLPEEKTLVVRWADLDEATASIETFDMTQFCTSRDHALLVAKYFLSIRRRVTHLVRFQTTPFGINLAPGDYIKVITQASPYSAANNGVIDGAGDITSAIELLDGDYSIVYWTQTNEETKTATLTVAGGKAVQPTLWNSIFTVNNASVSSNVYMVEQLTLNEDGLVDIVATEFPCTEADNSLIALDLTTSPFNTEG